MNAGDWIMLAGLMSALMPDCHQCGHAHGWHIPRSVMTGQLRCHKRTGWRRRPCRCRDYENFSAMEGP